MNLEKQPNLRFSRDLFLLSFYLRGIPFVDLVHLRKTDMRYNTIHYHRHKTRQQLSVYIEPYAADILHRYTDNADLAGNSKMTGGVNVWSSYQASIDMLQQYELGDTIRRNATFCTPGTYYSYICIADGGYTYDGATSCIKKGVPGGPDDDNDGYIQSMNSPLNTYILRLADVYLTYAEACLGNSEELAGGPGLEALNQVRDRARIPRKERVTFEDIIRERRVEFSMEYCNWYDMVSWYHWKPDYMLNYFQNQHRGYTVDLIVKDEDGYLHFGKKEGDTFLEGIENWQEPGENIEIHHGNILMPYPESDVIQNPLLNEEPVAYEFSE